MIIKAVQDDYLELRIRLTDSDSGEEISLNLGDMIEFKCSVRTSAYAEDDDEQIGKSLIRLYGTQRDIDGNIFLKLNLEDFHVIPGIYRFELNLVRADGTKTCLLPLKSNELIISEKEGDL